MITVIFAFIGGIVGGCIGCLIAYKLINSAKDPFAETEEEQPAIHIELKNENSDYLREQVKALHDRSAI